MQEESVVIPRPLDDVCSTESSTQAKECDGPLPSDLGPRLASVKYGRERNGRSRDRGHDDRRSRSRSRDRHSRNHNDRGDYHDRRHSGNHGRSNDYDRGRHDNRRSRR